MESDRSNNDNGQAPTHLLDESGQSVSPSARGSDDAGGVVCGWGAPRGEPPVVTRQGLDDASSIVLLLGRGHRPVVIDGWMRRGAR